MESKAKRILEMFVLGDKGLEPFGKESILLQNNTLYHMGYSSSPELILVIDTKDGITTYSKSPYKAILKDNTKMLKNLIQKGTETWLKTADQRIRFNPSAKTTKEKYEKLLRGVNVKPDVKSYKDLQSLKVEVKSVGKKTIDELWDELRKQYNVLGSNRDETILQLVVSRMDLPELEKNKDIEIVSVKDED